MPEWHPTRSAFERFARGELLAEEEQRIQEHLRSGCTTCRRKVDDLLLRAPKSGRPDPRSRPSRLHRLTSRGVPRGDDGEGSRPASVIDASALRPGYSTGSRDGFFAEFHPDGQLAHFGFYRQGSPRGWVLSLAAGELSARVEKTVTAAKRFGELFPEDGGEKVPDDPNEPSRVEAFEIWVRNQIRKIYQEAEKAEKADQAEGWLLCSFCRKTRYEVAHLICSDEANICDECVALCNDFIAEHKANPPG